MARDLAIDLGTANTLVYVRGEGIVLNEPSVIALNNQSQDVLAMGTEAWQMIGRTPGYIVAVRPLRAGAITDFDVTQRMIRLLLERVGVIRFNRPRVVICVPSAITDGRAAGGHRGRPPGRRGRGPAHRAAHGGGHRRRPADQRADGHHGRRHRRRHLGDPPSSPWAASSPSRPCGSARSTSTPPSRPTSAGSTASPSASRPRRRSRSRSARPTRRPRSSGPRCGAAS